MKFYICEHCGNIVTFLQSSGVPVMCCGQKAAWWMSRWAPPPIL